MVERGYRICAQKAQYDNISEKDNKFLMMLGAGKYMWSCRGTSEYRVCIHRMPIPKHEMKQRLQKMGLFCWSEHIEYVNYVKAQGYV